MGHNSYIFSFHANRLFLFDERVVKCEHFWRFSVIGLGQEKEERKKRGVGQTPTQTPEKNVRAHTHAHTRARTWTYTEAPCLAFGFFTDTVQASSSTKQH